MAQTKGSANTGKSKWNSPKYWMLGVAALFTVWITLGLIAVAFGHTSPATATTDKNTNDRRAFQAYQRCVEREGLDRFVTCGEAWGIKFQENYLRCKDGVEATEETELGTIVRCYDPKVSTE